MTTAAELLKPWLGADYCARCDSFGNTELRDHGSLWCNTCWDRAQPLPSSLRRLAESKS